MKKAGDLGLLGCSSSLRIRNGFVSTMLVCDYISGATGSFSTALHIQELELCQLLYMVLKNKTKYVPKLTSGEWFGAYCLLNQVLDLMLTSGKTKAFYLKMENIYTITGKKWFRMQVSVAYSSFLLVLEMIKYYWFHC
jgi:alkylation response protein AidB-like acyl-CoA dehydrogenase